MLAKKGLMTAPAAVAQYVEDVFSTYLFTGTDSSQKITNNIDLLGEGGLVWYKKRSSTGDHLLSDTVRSNYYALESNTTDAALESNGQAFTAVYSDGFDTQGDSGVTYATWTFRKAEKFFDVVTYTGNGTARTIAHNLGSTPGFIVVKCTSAGSTDWAAYHRSLGATKAVILNGTDAAFTISSYWNDTEPTSSVFSVGTFGNVNTNGATYVAYLFAHDAGGFGDAGDQSVIKCGSYSGTGAAGNSITLDWEPQWLLIKNASATYNWTLLDNMRGLTVADPARSLFANTTAAESDFGTAGASVTPTATGFQVDSTGAAINASGGTYIYIAIRRGPMKTPEAGTEVFYNTTGSTDSTSTFYTSGFPVDFGWEKTTTDTWDHFSFSRLQGPGKTLIFNSTGAETSFGAGPVLTSNTQFTGTGGIGGNNHVFYAFRRAPGFFDVVCYTGTGSARTISHNLGVAPEMMIVKKRNDAAGWAVYDQTNGATKWLELQDTRATTASTQPWNNTAPTSSVFTVGTSNSTNASSETFVAYLFASVTGVSKVGSYTGTGTTLQVNCGFTAGARFVLIKRTDSTGDWYVWDTARGIVSGNDPYLLLNSSTAEVTNTDYIDTYSSGFEISSTAPAAINANGGTFIYLAIA